MQTYVLERQQEIRKGRSEVFSFFADAFNLELITPSFLRFRVVNAKPVAMRAGTVLEYRLSLFLIRFRWKTLIEEWSPDEYFVDVQLRGPYSLWRHAHRFEQLGVDRTLIRDRVDYRLPFGPFGWLAHKLFVARTLSMIFDHRARMVDELLNQSESGATELFSQARVGNRELDS